MARIGPIFVSHGSPMMALSPTPAHRFLQGLGEQIGRPRAILCISAHWETTVPEVSGAEEPATRLFQKRTVGSGMGQPEVTSRESRIWATSRTTPAKSSGRRRASSARRSRLDGRPGSR